MSQIWKYVLDIDRAKSGDFGQAICELTMPVRALVLCVQTQRGVPCLWALVSGGNPEDGVEVTETRTFEVYGTGHGLCPADLQYIGTVQTREGALVLHVFERRYGFGSSLG